MANPYDRSVSVINTTSNTVSFSIENICTFPQCTAITPDGLHAYVTCSLSDEVKVIKTTDNTILTTVDVGSIPAGIAIRADGQYAYVANFQDSTVSVINTTSNQVNFTIHVPGARVCGIAITPVKVPLPYINPTAKPTNVPTTEPTRAPTEAPTSVLTTGGIIGLSFGGAAFVVLLGVGGYLIVRHLKKKEEDPAELNNLISPLSIQQKMVFL